MPFWEYQIPQNEITQTLTKLGRYTKPNKELTGKYNGTKWLVSTASTSRELDGRVYVEFLLQNIETLAYDLDAKRTTLRVLITKNFPYKILQQIEQLIGLNTKNWILTKQG